MDMDNSEVIAGNGCIRGLDGNGKNITKLKMDLPFDLATPPQGIYGKELRTLIQKNVSTPVHCSIIYNGQDLKAAQVPISR